MRRLALLVAVGTLWLFLAAVPALADGGPHVAADNSGVSTLTADGCAGCHRAHTASAPLLLVDEEPDLCFTCHGNTSVGATTDVMTGVQYAVGVEDVRGDTILGALRGGGFVQARLDTNGMERLSYLRTATAVSTRVKIGVDDPQAVTSSHIALALNGLESVLGGKAWGNGAAGTGAGPAASVSCTSCHNPHGNGQYRILNKFPEATGISDAWVVAIGTSNATNDTIGTQTSHALLAGDQITIAGHTGSVPDLNGTWYVRTATAFSNAFTISATLGGTTIDITTAGSGGTVTRTSGVPVTDATLPADGDTRNYTIMEVRGTEGTESTYLLYASNVADARDAGSFGTVTNGDFGPTGGDYVHRAVPWNPSVDQVCDPTVNNSTSVQPGCATANMAPNGRPSTFNAQMTAWCASCHTRYFANNNPTTPGATGTAASWQQPRPDESIFKYQHRTVAGRDCLTCHVSHGSNAAMTGDYSGNFPYPDGTLSPSSRLLKVDNRGTCQMCHDPTETVEAGTFLFIANGFVVSEYWPDRTYFPTVP